MALPERKRPVHWLPVERQNRSIIVFLTVCTKDRRPLLANQQMHAALRHAWAAAGHWRVGRYVVLPDHLHLFCAPGAWPPPPMKPWIIFWKRLVARETGLAGIWQEGFWDTQLRHHESYGAKWEYVRSNPVRHGLVSDADDRPYQGEIEVLDWHD
jgi:putative transposase